MKCFNLQVIIFTFLLLNLSILGNSIHSNEINEDETIPNSSAPETTFKFDGVISEGEWANQHKINFSLDVGNGDGDIDGQNYLYLGRDSTNLYAAYDFVSDQTDNPTDEWFGMWFNTKQRFYNTTQRWHDWLNNGTESFLYQIDNNRIYPYFDPSGLDITARGLNNNSEYSVKYGYTTGDYQFNDFNVTSQLVDSNYLYWINFSIYIPLWFSMFPDLYAHNISEIRFRFTHELNVSIAEHKLIMWNLDGSIPDFNDPNQVVPLSQSSGFQANDFYVGLGNITQDHRIRFTLFGNNTNHFNFTTSQLSWFPTRHISKNANTWFNQPYTSLSNYAIKWSFGGNFNNATAHRMFELVFPLSQFEEYNALNPLGFFIGGYGTAAFPGVDHWCFPYTDPFPYYNSSKYQYVLINATNFYIPPKETPNDEDSENDEVNGDFNIVGFDLLCLFASTGLISLLLIKRVKTKVKN